MDRCNLSLFGGLSLDTGSGTVDQFPTKRAAIIFARAALSRNGAVGRDELAEELWPEDYLDTTRLRLRQELKRLRTALGDSKDILDADRSWIRLDLERVSVDAREFDRALQLSEHADSAERRVELLVRACEGYRGPLLPEISEQWAFAARMDYRDRFERALENLVSHFESAGNGSEVAKWAIRALRVNPAHESVAISLVRALAAEGDVTEAMRTLEEYERANGTSPGLAALKRETRSKGELEVAPIEMPAVSASVVCSPGSEANVPEYYDKFFGRRQEQALLLELLGEVGGARCVSLVGPGGVGKTRLATEVAQALGKRGQAIRFVSMESLPGESLSKRLADETTAAQECIVVIDNAESDIDATARAVVEFLRGHPLAKVLCTSRQPLAIAGERAIDLDPIPTPFATQSFEEFLSSPAVLLFTDRAKALDPKFEIRPDMAVDLASLMTRLEGLPLAIELAAAKAVTAGVREMAARLDDIFTMLVTRRRDIPERQRSIYATIEWSYQGLDADLVRCLHAIAVCPGGISSEMLRSMLGTDVSESMHDLHDQSLVLVRQSNAGATRYRLLEPIRSFALSRMDAEENLQLCRAFAEALGRHCEGLWGYFNGPRESEAFEELEAEFENLLMAMNWGAENDLATGLRVASMTWRYWCCRGHRREGHATITKLLSHPGHEHNYMYAHALFGAGYTAHLMGRNEEAEAWFDKSFEAHHACGRSDRAAWVTLNMTCIADERGEYPRMYELAADTFPKFQEMETNIGMALAQADMATSSAQMGEFEKASHHMSESVRFRTLVDSPTENARIYFDKGRIAFEQGDLESAQRLLETSLPMFDSARQVGLQLDAMRYLAEALWEAGRLAESEDIIDAGEALVDRLGTFRDEAWFDRMRGFIALRRGDLEVAREEARKALESAIRDNFTHGMVDGVLLAIDVLRGVKRKSDARVIGNDLVGVAKKNGYWFRPSRQRWLDPWLESTGEAPTTADWQVVAAKCMEKLL